jgi:hypothetical protein
MYPPLQYAKRSSGGNDCGKPSMRGRKASVVSRF